MLVNLLDFSMQYGLFCTFIPIWGVSAILTGLYDHQTIVWQLYLQALRPWFSLLSRSFSKVLGRTAPRLRATSHEVFTFPSVSII